MRERKVAVLVTQEYRMELRLVGCLVYLLASSTMWESATERLCAFIRMKVEVESMIPACPSKTFDSRGQSVRLNRTQLSWNACGVPRGTSVVAVYDDPTVDMIIWQEDRMAEHARALSWAVTVNQIRKPVVNTFMQHGHHYTFLRMAIYALKSIVGLPPYRCGAWQLMSFQAIQ
eukprot:6360687-Amphidinium_carterae.1